MKKNIFSSVARGFITLIKGELAAYVILGLIAMVIHTFSLLF